MSLSAASVTRGTAPVAGGDGTDQIRKTDLVGQVVAFAVVDYDPAEPSKFQPGTTQPRVDVDLIVVTGPLAGTRDESWRTWGNLAGQMGAQPAGQTTVAKVASGPGKTPGSKWYGLDFDSVTDADLDAARVVIAGAEGGAAPQRVRLDVPDELRARIAAEAAAKPRGAGPAPDDQPPF